MLATAKEGRPRAWRLSLITCAICALMVATFAMVGCSSGDGGGQDAEGAASGESSAATDVPAATSTQTVTFPSAYFADPNNQAGQLESLGCTDVVDNGDGSFTASVPAETYNQIVSALHNQILQSASTLEDDPTYPNVESVTYDEGFAHVKVQLNTNTPGIEDTYALPMMGVPAATYQQVAGLPVGCEVSLVLEDGTVQQSSTFPM